MNESKQESFGTLSDGINLGLTLIFSVCRTVQIWSRVPGTTGNWFYGWMFAAGLALSAWYYEVNVEASQAMDFIAWKSMAVASVVWFGIHGVARALHQMRGLQFHSYEPGVGILARWISRLTPNHAGLISDLLVAVVLGISFKLLGSPIQSGWYFAMCVWLLIADRWIRFRDARQVQIYIDAQAQSEDWSRRVKH